ncbi:MAG: serine/threonine protein kinase [Ignavibacteria bacterium]|nr:serine/threonine protein kinase [Ignavibacteria bacterium]
MGEIYLAEHKFLERKAAVKVLHKTYSSNKDIRHRFIQEAQTLSRLDHPYIVKIFDFDQYQDVFYIIMEYVDGNTLDEYTRIKNGLMPEYMAKEFFIKVLSAVNYAHNNNIIHRDIKPSNIMISDRNEPKILDFGIARLIDSDRRVTKVNTKMGSILYMSPEQILGKEVDLKSDIYSLGITLYETLTANHPYDIEHESDYALQSKILNDYPPPPSAYYPMITKQMEFVISTAINKDPEKRFNSCIDFSEAINDPYYTSDYLYSNEEVFKPEAPVKPIEKEFIEEVLQADGEINEDENFDIEKPIKLERKGLRKRPGLKTKISEPVSSVINSENTVNGNQLTKESLSGKKNSEFNKTDLVSKKRFYESPVFYFSVLLFVLLGFALFYYNTSKDNSEDTIIINLDSTKTNNSSIPVKSAQEQQKIAEEKERLEKERLEKKNRLKISLRFIKRIKIQTLIKLMVTIINQKRKAGQHLNNYIFYII